MYLSETRDESRFAIQPSTTPSELGEVINFNDFFCVKSLDEKTPFFLHVFKKPTDDRDDDQRGGGWHPA